MQNTNNSTKRKSLRLSKEQKLMLKAYVGAFCTISEAAEALGVSRQVLDRVLLVWSGSPENISLILQKIGLPTAA